MTVTVSKATILENIYKNFYDLLNAITGFSSNIYPEFHDDVSLTDKSSYPIFILDSPDVSEETLTFGKTSVSVTISIDICTTTPKDTDQYASDAKDKIETSKGTLADMGLHMVFLDSTDKDVIPYGKIKVHIKTLTWRFNFIHTKTNTY